MDIVKSLADGKKSQDEERRDPPIEIESTLPEANNRYQSSNLNNSVDDGRSRPADYGRWDRTECPVFDGTTVFRSWLYKCEQFLETNHVPEHRKVRSVYYRLDGSALEWHQCFMEDKKGRLVTWDEYVDNMALCFNRNRVSDPAVQLKELKQEGSMEDYIQEFEKSRAQVKCSEIEALKLFLEGLKEKLLCLVNLHNPRTVREAFDYATLYELALIPIIEYSPCSRLVDENCNRAELVDTDNGMKELVFKEDKVCIFEDEEAKAQHNERKRDVVSQAIEGSMELIQELGVAAEFPKLCVAEFSEPCVEDEQLRPTVQKRETISNPEVVIDQAISSLKEESVADFPVRSINICLEEKDGFREQKDAILKLGSSCTIDEGWVYVMELMPSQCFATLSTLLQFQLSNGALKIRRNFKKRKKKLQFVKVVIGDKDNLVGMVQSSSKTLMLQALVHEGTDFGRTHFIMKQLADQNRNEREFNVGDWVFLKLHPFMQLTLLQQQQSHKLSPKYCGLFQIIRSVGAVAFELRLPSAAKSYDVVQVCLLKKCWTNVVNDSLVTSLAVLFGIGRWIWIVKQNRSGGDCPRCGDLLPLGTRHGGVHAGTIWFGDDSSVIRRKCKK